MKAVTKRHEAKIIGAHKMQEGNSVANRAPSLYEMEYLDQVIQELEIFLHSRSVSTLKGIYFGFQGEGYRGQVLLSR